MGNQKLKWTAEEEEALVAGIDKHGTGKWKNILRDTEFSSSLKNRSNIDLKDKWRNMSVSASGERPRSSKSSHLALPSATDNFISGSAPAHLSTPTQDATTDTAFDDSPNESPKSNSASVINSMIFDALKASNNTQGSDIGMIVRYIKDRYEAPHNIKRLLGSKLRRLVAQGKLTKLENRYTIRNDSAYEWHKSLMEASETAAYKIDVAERKSFLAHEAVKEADRVSELAEETDCFVEIVKDIYERCSRDEAVYMNLTWHK